jgi:hypothetical protein
LEPDQLRAGLLTLDRPNLDARAYGDLSARLVSRHPDAWRAWVGRAQADDLPIDERLQAVERAWRLAPGEMEVLRLVAIRALIRRDWEEARALGTRAWLRGANAVFDRVVIALAEDQLGRCAEFHSWAPAVATESAEFASRLARLRGEIAATNRCP